MFKEKVGSLVVSGKADTGKSWVLRPSEVESVEVTGSCLDPAADRIMVVDCGTPCGTGVVTTAVAQPDPSFATFAAWRANTVKHPELSLCTAGWQGSDYGIVADPAAAVVTEPTTISGTLQECVDRCQGHPECVGFTRDSPDSLEEGLQGDCALLREVPPPGTSTTVAVGTQQTYIVTCPSPTFSFATHSDRVCTGRNFVGPFALQHACGVKCPACEGAGCFCEGYVAAVDAGGQEALCLPREQCLQLCDAEPECHSVDMHKRLPRCFLNLAAPDGEAGSCLEDARSGNLEVDTSYDLLQKEPLPGEARRLHSEDDGGVSSVNVLRFAPLSFREAGSYKVCFCSSSEVRTVLGVASTTAPCSQVADYNVEVGRIHVSGVAEVLAKSPKLRRQRCYLQYHGGLSCADSWTVGATVLDAAQH